MPRVSHGVRRREFRRSRVARALDKAESQRLVEQSHWLEHVLAITYITGGVLFVVGSIFFLPGFERFYHAGCLLFLIGGTAYLTTSSFDLEEAEHAGKKFEYSMALLYVYGGCFFIVATFIFVPEITQAMGPYSAQLWGSWGFIVGSLFFVLACFLNGAHTGDAFKDHKDDPIRVYWAQALVLATTFSTMLGSILFLVGSILYLPNIGCDEGTVTLGTCCYIAGSFFFVVAGLLPILRTKYFNLVK